MRARLHFPESSDLYKYFNEKEGEIIESTTMTAHVKVELDGHTPLNPSTAVIMTPWSNIEVISG